MIPNRINALLFASALLSACGGGGEDSQTANDNKAPIANAGTDITTTIGETVKLSALQSSDPDGDKLTYNWTLQSKPTQSTATLSSPSSESPTFSPDANGAYVLSLTVSDGSLTSEPSTIVVTVGDQDLSQLPAASLPTETSSKWIIRKTTSAVSGETKTFLILSSLEADFVVECLGNGRYYYYLSTSKITNDGAVKIRVGNNTPLTEYWSESASSGYDVLFPTFSLITDILPSLYKNWDLAIEYNGFNSGKRTATFRASGLSSAMDKTRAECGWSSEVFPPKNGWGLDLPTATPANAIEGTDVSGLDKSKSTRLIAWLGTNASGKKQLIARVGDPSNDNNSFVIDDTRFYVTQNNKTVSAVTGLNFQSRAAVPTVVSLNGDFDVNKPFTLTLVGFHYYSIDNKTPVSVIDFK